MSCSSSTSCSCLDTSARTTGVKHLLGLVAVSVVTYAVAAGGLAFLMHRAESNAHHHYSEWAEAKVAKLVTDAKKATPKGTAPNLVALRHEAEEKLLTDAKLKAEAEKAHDEAEHHAQSGLFPLAVFVGIASGLLAACFAAVLLIKRLKDAGIRGTCAFVTHIPSAALFAFVGMTPIALHLAHHEHCGLVEMIKTSTPVTLGAGLAAVGALVHLVLVVLPSRKTSGDDHAHDHDDSHACCAH